MNPIDKYEQDKNDVSFLPDEIGNNYERAKNYNF